LSRRRSHAPAGCGAEVALGLRHRGEHRGALLRRERAHRLGGRHRRGRANGGGLRALQRLAAGGDEAHVVPGLGDEIERAVLERLHGQVDVRVGGHHHHDRRLRARLHVVQQAQALRAIGAAGAEVQVEEKQRGSQRVQRRRKLGRTTQAGDVRHAALQQQLRGKADVRVVVKKKNGGVGHGRQCRSLERARGRGVSGSGQPSWPPWRTRRQCIP
jgi:hypothetical protein